MVFEKIDKNSWNRKEYFDHYFILPLAIQVHHAVCDGFHICRFVNELQELINS